MEKKVITSNATEKTEVKWDDVRFGIVQGLGYGDDVVVLNPREMHEIAEFERKHNGKYRRELWEKKLLENIGKLEG